VTIDDGRVRGGWKGGKQVFEALDRGKGLDHVLHQADPEARQGEMDAMGRTVGSGEVADAVDDVLRAELWPIVTKIEPGQTEVIAVVECGVRPCTGLEGMQKGIVVHLRPATPVRPIQDSVAATV